MARIVSYCIVAALQLPQIVIISPFQCKRTSIWKNQRSSRPIFLVHVGIGQPIVAKSNRCQEGRRSQPRPAHILFVLHGGFVELAEVDQQQAGRPGVAEDVAWWKPWDQKKNGGNWTMIKHGLTCNSGFVTPLTCKIPQLTCNTIGKTRLFCGIRHIP